MSNNNRFLASDEAMEEATTNESLFKIVVGGVGSGLIGYWLGLKALATFGGPVALPLFFAILAPVLFAFALIAYAQIITVGDIKAEAIEAIQIANETVEKANAVASDASAYHSLALEMQTLTAEKQTLEKDFQDASNRCVEYERVQKENETIAEKRLEEAEENATKLAENTALFHTQTLQTLQKKLETAEATYSLLTEAIGYKKKAASASGRSSASGANAELKAVADAEKIEYLAKYAKALEANPFLWQILEAKV